MNHVAHWTAIMYSLAPLLSRDYGFAEHPLFDDLLFSDMTDKERDNY